MPITITLPGATDRGDGPGDIQNVFFWVRSDKEHATSMEVVALDSVAVEAWIDQSLWNHHIYAVGTAEPTFVENTITCDTVARDGIHFDGTSDILQSEAMPEIPFHFTDHHSISVHIAFRADNNTDATLFSIGHEGVDRDGFSVSLVPNGVVIRLTLQIACGGGGDYFPLTFVFPSGFVYDDDEVHTISFLYDGTLPDNQARLVLDDTDISVTIDTIGMLANSNIITVGDDYTGGFFYEGDLFEIVAQTTARNADRVVLRDYYQRKWCAV